MMKLEGCGAGVLAVLLVALVLGALLFAPAHRADLQQAEARRLAAEADLYRAGTDRQLARSDEFQETLILFSTALGAFAGGASSDLPLVLLLLAVAGLGGFALGGWHYGR